MPLTNNPYAWYGTAGYLPSYVGRTSTPVPVAPLTPTAIAVSTGVNPMETSYSLYGHPVPLLVIGKARIGSEIISGPWIDGGLGSAIFSCGVEADPTRTRTLTELSFDSQVVWTGSLADGGTPNPAGFTVEPFTFRFHAGSWTQPADALEIAHFGADAVAYRPQILIAIEGLPLANQKFGKIPYVSGVILDQDGEAINFGEAFERLAASVWTNLPDFETSGLTDGVPNGGFIFAQDAEFLQTIQGFGRFYPRWDILQTDKLRIIDRGATIAPDITLDTTRLMDHVVVTRQGADSVTRELALSTIDPDADYTIVESLAQVPRDPVAVTTSVGRQSLYLPVIMDASTRISIVTFAKYHDERTRKKFSGTAMAYGLEIEPGTLVELAPGGDFGSEVIRITETTRGANNVVEFMGEAILSCGLVADPDISDVVLLLGFEGADASTGAPGLTDESPAAHGTASTSGAAQIDTAQSKFGSSSLLLAPTDDFVYFGYSSDWALSNANSDQFAIEYWIRYSTVSSGVSAISLCHAGDGTFGFEIRTSGTEIQYRWSPTGLFAGIQTLTTSGAALTTGQFYAIAVTKDSGGTLRIFIDGVMLAKSTPADSTFHAVSAPQVLTIGGRVSGSSAPAAYIDEVRITKGNSRHASDGGYTVATAAFPRE